jgi:PAS domain S-box-containing protein
LLPADCWQKRYEETFQLYAELAEAAYLCNQPEVLHTISAEAFLHCQTVDQKARIYESLILWQTVQGRIDEAVATSLHILKELGIKFPRKPGVWHIILGLIQTNLRLPKKQMVKLVDRKQMTEAVSIATARMLVMAAGPFFLNRPDLYPLAIFKLVQLSLKKGNCPESLVGYGSFGLILAGITGDIESGQKIGKQSLMLYNKYQRKDLFAISQFTYYFFIHPWCASLHEAIEPLAEGYERGLEAGSIDYAAWCRNTQAIIKFFAGENLVQLQADFIAGMDFMNQYGIQAPLNISQVFYSLVRNLSEQKENPVEFKNEFFNEHEAESMLQSLVNKNDIASFYGAKFLAAMYFNRYDLAQAELAKALKFESNIKPIYIYAMISFFKALLAARRSETGYPLKKAIMNMKAERRKLLKWKQYASGNNEQKVLLIEAELLRLQGQHQQAQLTYNQALLAAQKNKFINDEAVIAETAMHFYEVSNQAELAGQFRDKAIRAWRSWGAEAKAHQLEQEIKKPVMETTATVRSSSMLTGASLDFSSVVKNLQSISGEIELDKLVQALMKNLIENAGAETGKLFLVKENELFLQAEANTDNVVNMRELQPLQQLANVCKPVLLHVFHKNESIVLSDAQTSAYSRDPHIQAAHVRSVLCLPIQHKGKITGVTYLENNLAADVFTTERIEIATMMSKQAAISIENAVLYDNLKQEIDQRKQAQEEVKQSEQRLKQYLEGVSMGVFVIDAEGKPFYANRTAQELLGQGIADTSAGSLAQVYKVYNARTGELYPEQELPIVKALQGTASSIDDMEIHRPDGIIPLEVSATPIVNAQGKIEFAIAAFQDISQRLQAKRALEEYNLTLERKVKERTAEVEWQRDEIEKEKKKSDELLLNILPQEVMLELKATGKTLAKNYDLVTVVFIDFVNFTSIIEEMPFDELVHTIDFYFEAFDRIIEKHEVEKIKTVGDAYIFAAGLPVPNHGNPLLATEAALDIQAEVNKINKARREKKEPCFEVRIGIHSGPVVAGVVGIKKFAYDIWGDTVNTAARMQQMSDSGKINISRTTHDLVKHRFNCTYRGRAEVKHKGEIEMYFVEGKK